MLGRHRRLASHRRKPECHCMQGHRVLAALEGSLRTAPRDRQRAKGFEGRPACSGTFLILFLLFFSALIHCDPILRSSCWNAHISGEETGPVRPRSSLKSGRCPRDSQALRLPSQYLLEPREGLAWAVEREWNVWGPRGPCEKAKI